MYVFMLAGSYKVLGLFNIFQPQCLKKAQIYDGKVFYSVGCQDAYFLPNWLQKMDEEVFV